ncbi:hypothetical protein SLA2020_095920 [Shorea laevis]
MDSINGLMTPDQIQSFFNSAPSLKDCPEISDELNRFIEFKSQSSGKRLEYISSPWTLFDTHFYLIDKVRFCRRWKTGRVVCVTPVEPLFFWSSAGFSTLIISAQAVEVQHLRSMPTPGDNKQSSFESFFVSQKSNPLWKIKIKDEEYIFESFSKTFKILFFLGNQTG